MLGVNQEKRIAWIDGFPLVHFFTTKKFGNVSEKYGQAKTKELYQEIESVLGKNFLRIHIIPYGEEIIAIENNKWLRGFAYFESFSQGVFLKIDNKRFLAITLFPADCYPLLFVDEKNTFFGLLHGGFEQARKKIIEKGLLSLLEKLKIEPRSLIVGIGPGIKKCCYRADLLEMIQNQLKKIGIKKRLLAETCTCCTKIDENYLFFSHSRSKNTKDPEGRFACVLTSKALGSG